jgi:predicted N-acetyltransferase YhbS
MATLRNPRESDAPAISALMEELGHPMEPHQIVAQLKALVKHPGTAAWVAEQNGEVVGYGQSHVIPSLHYPAPVAMLTALVVAQRAQGRRGRVWRIARPVAQCRKPHHCGRLR